MQGISGVFVFFFNEISSEALAQHTYLSEDLWEDWLRVTSIISLLSVFWLIIRKRTVICNVEDVILTQYYLCEKLYV